MKIKTYSNPIMDLISAVCMGFVLLFTFLAVFQPGVLDEYVPQYADAIRGAVQIVTNFIHNIFNKITV